MNEILDQPEGNKIESLTNHMDRVRHFSIDSIVIIGFSLIFYFNIIRQYYQPSEGKLGIVFFIELLVVYFLYYLIFEYTTSKTLGKMLNRTIVLNSDGEKPSFKQLFIRTVVRLLPFSFITLFSPYQRFIHDIVSGTWVVRVKKQR